LSVTIHDVARKAHVSVATVSRALALPDLVADATRARVLAAAKLLGYQPNRAARSLITGKTGNLGIIVPDLGNPFYPNILKGAQSCAHQSSHSVLLADSDEDPAQEEALVRTMAKQVDGIVICAPFASDARLLKMAELTTLVLINRSLPGVPSVLMDIAGGMTQAVAHLVSLGHRRCAFLNGPNIAWSTRERRRGMRAAAATQGLNFIEFGPFEPKFEGGLEGADVALKQNVTTIVAFNDLMALGVLSRLAACGVRVPQDVSVVGFDDLLYATMCAPALTTVAMPMEAAGSAAVHLLLERVGSEQPERNNSGNRHKLPTKLIVRGTTAAPSARGTKVESAAKRVYSGA
jgi:LacI family transcriptional regulator